ncbi:MAG: AI-2E family transporter [Acidocella sp. 20-57-95]|nr:MAG: AI-2E family transporter [Acidocella sp. 20-57-95]OYV58471.1 MAG: AI-2E family transporter [Acidocella sp. 21-58-7]HQT64353.1 AI-2E family transporter [Acidocella sp.]
MSEISVQDQTARKVQWQRLGLLFAFLAILWVFFQLFSSVLMPFVVAAGVAYFLDPAVSHLSGRGIPRSIGTTIVLGAVLLFVVLFILLLYPVITAQASILVANLPGYIKTAQTDFGHIVTDLQARLGPGVMSQKLKDLASNQAGEIVSFVESTASSILGSGFAVVNILTLFVITPIVAFYFLRDWPSIVHHVDTWLPRPYEAVIRVQALEVNRILAAWIRGQAICCLMLAVIYATGLTIVGLDLGLIVGLAAGILSFIPYVGTIIGASSSVLLVLSQSPGWHGVLSVLAVFALGQAINDYIIQPRFLGDRVGLPAVWVIFSLFAGGAAFGFLGIMLAVPVTATLGVLARFWLKRYLMSPLYLDPPPSS